MMNGLDWLVACVPILSFGAIPVVATLVGGKPVEQSMGIAIGGVLFAVVVFIFKQPQLDARIFWIGLASGMLWAIGSVGQFMGITYLGVARSMPVSDGGQIIGTSLLGILLGDWATHSSKMFGFAALILIIAGICFTSYKQNTGGVKPQWKKGLGINLVSVLGFTFYVGILKYFRIDGWDSILPQSFGQVIGIALISLVFFKAQPFTKPSLKNGIVGIIWATGNIALLLSQARVGLSVAYPVSQASVIVSVLGGVYFNKERKTRKEWISTVIGMLIIVAGLYLIYQSSIHDT